MASDLRVHCAEALGTPIVGDYKYGWFMHRRYGSKCLMPMSSPRMVHRRSCKGQKNQSSKNVCRPMLRSKPDFLHFMALMPSQLKISLNIMSSYLV
ncbi:hypothetical protein Pint_11601 [Pistacia integerrima]|uniref:Uncharacterized protein n=1 Tax=Pistacia integerrima TaxID=434235 RepID=A0ACC0XJ79_9ROSI|nr:hypothetical protein Pint_11601 [Pistacia integerrima]